MERFNKEELKDIEGDELFDRLCELNVVEQVSNVSNTTIVRRALAEGADLSIHGWIYNISNGILKDLCVDVNKAG